MCKLVQPLVQAGRYNQSPRWSIHEVRVIKARNKTPFWKMGFALANCCSTRSVIATCAVKSWFTTSNTWWWITVTQIGLTGWSVCDSPLPLPCLFPDHSHLPSSVICCIQVCIPTASYQSLPPTSHANWMKIKALWQKTWTEGDVINSSCWYSLLPDIADCWL